MGNYSIFVAPGYYLVQITANVGVVYSYLISSNGNASVSSIGLSMPGIFTVAGSPITTFGTFTVGLGNQAQNLFFASPDGSSGTPAFRTMATADVPWAIPGTIGSTAPNTGVFTTLGIGGGTLLTSSNQTGTGNIVLATAPTLSPKLLNNIPKCDQFPGATADVKLNNCIAALSPLGGIADARGFGATTQSIIADVAVGSATKRVALLTDARTLWQISVADGSDVFPIGDGSQLYCEMIGGPQAFGGQAGFALTSSANIKSIIAPVNRNNFSIMIVKGCTFIGNPTHTVSSAMVDLQAIGLGSVIEDLTIYYPYNTIGLLVHPGASIIASDINLKNIQVNGGGVVGARPCVLQGGGNTTQLIGLAFFGGGCQHAGTGQYELEIDGLNGAIGPVSGIQGIEFYNWHEETITGSLGTKIRDATGIKFVAGTNYSGGGSTNQYTLSESTSGLLQDIEIAACRCTSGSLAQYIVNTAAGGTTIPNVSTAPYLQPEYRFKAPNSSWTLQELASPPTPAEAGKTVCYADLTTHIPLCNYNNTSFLGLTQTVGVGTATSAGTIINAGTSQTLAVTVTGATTTDTAHCATNVAFPATWQTGIQVLPPVVTANTVTLTFSNPTAGNITPVAQGFRCTVTR